jgi:hypothetical protein
MRSLRARQQRLPRFGDRFELHSDGDDTASVVGHRSGRRRLDIRRPGDEAHGAGSRLGRDEATALAALHTGAIIEVTTVPMA